MCLAVLNLITLNRVRIIKMSTTKKFCDEDILTVCAFIISECKDSICGHFFLIIRI